MSLIWFYEIVAAEEDSLSEDDVREGVTYNSTVTDLMWFYEFVINTEDVVKVGTLVLPDTSNVRSGIGYGANGIELNGILTDDNFDTFLVTIEDFTGEEIRLYSNISTTITLRSAIR